MAEKNIMRNWGNSVFSTFIKYNSEMQGTVNEHLSPASRSYILFECEGIIAVICQPEMAVDFYTSKEEYICTEKLPAVEDGRRVYLDICCAAEKDAIIFKLPVYKWIDNYPHCDGESDRWDTKVLGYHTMRFSLLDNTSKIDLFK